MRSSPSIVRISRCPVCRSALGEHSAEALHCAACQRYYPVRDGIPRLRPKDACEHPEPTAPDLSILLLTLNEGDNLRHFLPPLKAVLADLECVFEILVLDGGSQDDTVEVALSHGATVHMQTAPGFGNAYRQGLSLCCGDRIAILDADLSHDPGLLRVMYPRRHSADLVIGSRYMQGGGANTGSFKLFLSMLMNQAFRLVTGSAVLDMSSGYRLAKRTFLQRLPLTGRDFEVVVEVSAVATTRGYEMCEVPMFYKPRGAGVSKVRLARFARSYAALLMRVVRERADHHRQRGLRQLAPVRHAIDTARFHLLRDRLGYQDPETLLFGKVDLGVARAYPCALLCSPLESVLELANRHTAQLVQAEVEALPFADGAFAHVIYFEEPGRPLDERVVDQVRRVLRPGGHFIILRRLQRPGVLHWPVLTPLPDCQDVQFLVGRGFHSPSGWNLANFEKIWSLVRTSSD